ncbi:MAG: DUF58 domain-containing protein [Brevinematia bacterium]
MAKYIILTLLVILFLILFPFYPTAIFISAIALLFVFNKLYTSIVVKNFRIERYLETTKIFHGDNSLAGLKVYNKSIFPIVLYVYDYTSMELSLKQKETFFVFLLPKSSKTLNYRIVGTKRGDHYLGPTVVEFKDIFMNTFISKEFETTGFVTVFPSILAYSNIEKSILQPYGEIKNKLPIFEDITKIQGIREYQQGDEIRKINWKVSARHNKLYVNYYTPSVSSGSVVILNLYHPDYDMKYPEFYEEFSIELATTIVFDLNKYGQEVGFITSGEIRRKSTTQSKSMIENPVGFLEMPISSGNSHITDILEILAKIHPQNKTNLKSTFQNISIQVPWGTAIILITPNLDEETAILLTDYIKKGHEVFIFNTHPHKTINYSFSSRIKLFNTLKVENTVQLEKVI